MLKNITVFKLDEPTKKLLSPSKLEATIPEPTAADPGKTEWMRVGFSLIQQSQHTVYVAADNTRLFNIQVRERILPGKVIKKHVEEKVAELKERGHTVNRKDRMQIKDEVIGALLPTAFIRQTDIPCMVVKDYLIVGTANARLVDISMATINTAYRMALGLRHMAYERDPRTFMFDLLALGTTYSGVFTCGTSAVLRGDDKRTARFKDIENISAHESVKDALKDGMKPIEMRIVFDEHTYFTLTDKMLIKGIKFSDVLMKDTNDAETEIDMFDGTLAIVSGTLKALIDELMKEIAEEEEL